MMQIAINKEDRKLQSGKKNQTISYRVSDSIYAALQEVAQKERRDLSDIGRALLERGLLAYGRDGRLFEAVPGDEILALSMQQIITDLYGGVTPADAEKFKNLMEKVGSKDLPEIKIDPAVLAQEEEGTRNAIEYENQMNAKDKTKRRKTS